MAARGTVWHGHSQQEFHRELSGLHILENNNKNNKMEDIFKY